MKKIFKAMGRPFKPFLNFSTFLGVKELKGSYENLTGMAKGVTKQQKKEDIIQETFEQAQARLALSEQDLINRKKSFFQMSICYFIMAVLLFAYMFYLAFTGVVLGVFISFVLVIVALAFSYREHFWYTQMQHRRLGLTFKDWKAYTFGGRKK